MALSVYTPTGIVHETSVDFTKRVLAEPVHLVQYDASLPVLEVSVYDAGQYLTLTESDTVSIRMDKGDGTFVYNPALGMSSDGHKVYVQITSQMTVNYGRFEPVLELLRGNGYGCSSPIPLFIDVNPVSEDEIESTSEYGTIIEIRNEVQELKDETQEIIDSSVMTFDEAATRENINSGESLSTIMGKVKKWFADLKEAAFCGVANNLVTPADTSGLVLDARKGKELKDLHDTNASDIASLNSSLTVTEEYLRFTYENKIVNIYFRKYGKMITVLMEKNNESMVLPTSWTSVGNLTNIKPPSDRYISFVSSNGYTGVIRIYPDGGVRILGHSSEPMWLQCSATTML